MTPYLDESQAEIARRAATTPSERTTGNFFEEVPLRGQRRSLSRSSLTAREYWSYGWPQPGRSPIEQPAGQVDCLATL